MQAYSNKYIMYLNKYVDVHDSYIKFCAGTLKKIELQPEQTTDSYNYLQLHFNTQAERYLFQAINRTLHLHLQGLSQNHVCDFCELIQSHSHHSASGHCAKCSLQAQLNKIIIKIPTLKQSVSKYVVVYKYSTVVDIKLYLPLQHFRNSSVLQYARTMSYRRTYLVLMFQF